ncbi:ABC transporter substrate-binding protein [Desulfovibrio sp. TomC]|uniref:ABC transporter substrate-binding protein n=1 Tax=Desulfovibrio sp. TomC TaxID=1562888 RepID=UPI000575B1EA|nr:ABC transporter substrate-binding protein [Desulfovibrio sp. TomC]KHK01304.1 Hydroxymethylpyrimidine ABC transporter, substrate-binding component [Desulfovibrio sp. TomC]
MLRGKWRYYHVWTILAGLFALALASAACAAEPLKKAALIPQWEPQAQFAGYYVALAKGFYTREGVDLTILRGGPGQPPSRLLRQGTAQFGTFFLTTAIEERAAGLPLVNLAQFVPHSTLLLIARKADGIQAPADLDGRRVSLWGPEFRMATQAFFRRNGLRVTTVPQGFTVDLFLRGGVAACSAMRYNEYHAIINAGLDPEELTVFSMADHGLDLPEDGLYTLEETARNDPELVRGVTRASLAGWRYAFAHPDEALDIVMSHVSAAHLPTNRMHQQWMLAQIKQAMTSEADPLGTLARERYETTAQALRRVGLITAVPEYEAFHVPLP